MRKFLFALFGLICTLSLNGAVGAVVGGTIGQPLYGALAAGGAAVVGSVFGGFAPAGALRAGLLTEVWTRQMINAFRTDPESVGWYDRIQSYDQYVNNDVIHFALIGGDPDVLLNNTTYPIAIQALEDGDKAVSLDKYQTKATPITDDELYALSYDKKSSVIARHKDALKEKIYERAIHALAPAGNTTATPVITTTGDTVDGRKAMTRSDLIKLKKLFDKNNVPKAERILVLCSDHIADLLETDQKFAGQYYNYTSGKIANLYSFEIYEYNECPYYNASTLSKLAFGAATADTDQQASVAFSLKRAMKANGSVQAYASEAKNNPQTQQSLLNYRTYSICLPLKLDAQAAIVSAKV